MDRSDARCRDRARDQEGERPGYRWSVHVAQLEVRIQEANEAPKSGYVQFQKDRELPRALRDCRGYQVV